jgi:hypothetical protein
VRCEGVLGALGVMDRSFWLTQAIISSLKCCYHMFLFTEQQCLYGWLFEGAGFVQVGLYVV